MIRTELVKLTAILNAVAFRQKLKAGGSGIVILRPDQAQPGIASISKTSGEAIPAANMPAEYYPDEALQEAIRLTSGLPYNKRGNPSDPFRGFENVQLPEEEEIPELEVVIDSSDYQKILEAYTDKNGKFSYDLLNKDLIKFAHSSSRVRAMIADREPLEDIRLYIVGTKFRNITGNRSMSDDQVLKIAELLDELDPKGIFRELNDELKKKLKK